MIKRTATTVIGLAVLLAMIGCESTGDRVDNASSSAESRTNSEIDNKVDDAIDDAFKK